ncbi:MAG: sugar ABC transporter substrate-binding protein [Chthonomonadales bacterium]|nr:sugar ABC transporter substrate-binding protein [Chthonomonadales bacterium]
MNRTRLAIGAVLAPLMLTALMGCEPSKPKEAQPAAPPVAEKVTTAELEAVQKAQKSHKLALVVKTRNNPFFDPMIKAAEAEAKRLGVSLEVQAPPQESDKELQFSIVENLTAKGVDAILIAPADSKGIVPALKRAADKGVLVINLDNRVDPEAAASGGLALGGYVGADNEEGGRLAGQAMMGYLGGFGKVAILEGIRGADNAEARKRGFENAVQGSLEIVAKDTAEWDTQKAYAKFQSMLAAHPDVRGLFCANDKMALGAMKAIEESGRRRQITVIGYDNIPEIRPYLAAGDMKATIEQHPDLMGRYGVLMAVGVLDGVIPRGREFLVPLEIITKP